MYRPSTTMINSNVNKVCFVRTKLSSSTRGNFWVEKAGEIEISLA